MYLTMGGKRRLGENLKLGEKSATYNFTKKGCISLLLKDDRVVQSGVRPFVMTREEGGGGKMKNKN
jgi:hypothetical protein